MRTDATTRGARTLEQEAGDVLALAEDKRRADHRLRLARMALAEAEATATRADEALARARRVGR
jgi:hypothetical protein